MPRRTLLLPVICLSLVSQETPKIGGHWEGILQNQGKAVITLDLVEGNPMTGTLGLPEAGISAPLDTVTLQDGALRFKATIGGQSGTYEGRLSADGTQILGSATGATGVNTLNFGRGKASSPNPVQERYTKQEVMIPMRDGVKLFTSIYLPKDTSKDHPILLQRTPYSVAPYGADKFRRGVGPSRLFLDEGYIVAYQDVRGRNMSEGAFVDTRPVNEKRGPKDIDETTDTYDTIEWLVKNLPHNNGRVGQWGISYPGHYTIQGMLSGHPALKAVSPQAPMIDLWEGDDSYHRGAFQLAANFEFFTFFKAERDQPSAEQPKPIQIPDPDGYHFFLQAPNVGALASWLQDRAGIWKDYVSHSTYDAYWKARDLRPHLHDVKPAVLTVGGWFDAEDPFGPQATFCAVEKQSPATDDRLVIGPWTHGQWASGDASEIGNARWGAKTSAWYQAEVELPFFNHHLKGDPDPGLAKATMFETGTNQWRKLDAWPPKEAQPRSLYFEAKGRIGFDAPGKEDGFSEFVSDPAHPVPYTQAVSFGYYGAYVTEDQRFAATRPDVLVFETEPLKEDLTLAGPVKPVLNVSTSGTDADWIVKLIDVFPDGEKDLDNTAKGFHYGGYQMLVRGDAIRGKFRRSFDKPEPFTPGQPDQVAFAMNDVFHTFKKGHRLMVQVQCSWFPLVDRNPQTFTDIPTAKPEDFRKATQRVYHDAARPSRLEVLELKP
jgi:putative CocE/NonD family hydrolase